MHKQRLRSIAAVAALWLWGPFEQSSAQAQSDATSFRRAPTQAPRTNNRNWWRQFADPHLDAWLERALTQQPDLAVARARIAENRARRDVARAAMLPTLSWDSSAQLMPLNNINGGPQGQGQNQAGGPMNMANVGNPMAGGNQAQDTAPPRLFTSNSLLQLAFEIDLTGRNALGYRASGQDIQSSRLDQQSRAETLAADLVANYHRLVAARQQAQLVHTQIETHQGLLELTELRFKTGQATAVEVLQQRQQLASNRANLPQAELQAELLEHTLAQLAGEPPGADFATRNTLPQLGPLPGLGRPGDLAEVRPDLRAAQALADSAATRHRIARRTLAPTLRVTGQFGVALNHIMDNAQANTAWGVGATLSIPIFMGGRNYAQIKQASAAASIANEQRNVAQLRAVVEVENALARETRNAEIRDLVAEQLATARQAFEESRRRYAAGLGSYLSALTALDAVSRAEIALLSADLDRVLTRVELHRALGGALTLERLPSRNHTP